MFEKRVLKKIFGSARDEITGGRNKLDNGRLHNLHFSSYILRMIK
jgi:hypothetical protein